MKLGEMLIRDGRVSQEQVDQALAHQTQVGGRIGSILVELGYLDAEALTVYLGLELGMPIATGATLERCKRSAVRLLTPQQAAHYRCVPIVIQGQTLILATDDPNDFQALDALHNITGYRVLPRIAPEIRIYYYLERFYGISRPPRYRALGDSPRGNSALGSHAQASGLPGPPLPGLPPKRQTPIAAPTPRPVVRRTVERQAVAAPAETADAQGKAPAPPPTPDAKRQSPPPTPAEPQPRQHARPQTSPEEQEALELDANDLVIELEADDAEVADRAPTVSGANLGIRTRRTTAPVAGPIAIEDALAAMADTEQRGTVADAVLGYAAGVFEVAALCLVRDRMALGWRGFGPELDHSRIETLLVPLEMPSIFQSAHAARELYRGHAFPSALHDQIFKVLRSHVPAWSIIVPISIGNRVVNMLYGHKADGSDLTDVEVTNFQQLGEAASQVYVRLISASKARRPKQDDRRAAD